MADSNRNTGRRKRPPRPLNTASLRDLALSYVARFATSATKLERYLRRKVRERGWEDDEEPDLAALVARYCELGYVDDEAYARARGGDLLRRGYGARRIAQALGEAGIDEAVRHSVAPGEWQARESVVALARRRRFGPFFRGDMEPARREKQLAAIMRAGHGFDSARRVVDARETETLDAWVEEARDNAREEE